jgi:hypothetical protein
MIEYFVMTASETTFEKFSKQYSHPEVKYTFFVHPSQIRFIAKPNICMLPDAWMHHNFDDLIDALEDRGMSLTPNIKIEFSIRSDQD